MEQDDLIKRIESVKARISDFEKELNINFVESSAMSLEQNNGIIQKIHEYKKRIDDIEKNVLNTEENHPLNTENSIKKQNYADSQYKKPEALLNNSDTNSLANTNILPKENKHLNLPYEKIEEKGTPTDLGIDNTLNKVKKDAQEVESISNMLDKLKDTLGAIKPTIESKNQLKESSNKNVNKPRKEVINGNENVNLVSSKVISNKDLQGNSKKPSGDIKTNITENDLHSLSEIIIKLDELLRSNKELSDKLSDLIKEQKESNRNVNNSRTNELIRRLAYMGTNIN